MEILVALRLSGLEARRRPVNWTVSTLRIHQTRKKESSSLRGALEADRNDIDYLTVARPDMTVLEITEYIHDTFLAWMPTRSFELFIAPLHQKVRKLAWPTY